MFREPTLRQCISNGDNERWLWVMEPEKGRIFGKAFVITESMLIRDKDAGVAAQQDAFEEMILRSEFDMFVMEEGSDWEAFL